MEGPDFLNCRAEVEKIFFCFTREGVRSVESTLGALKKIRHGSQSIQGKGKAGGVGIAGARKS